MYTSGNLDTIAAVTPARGAACGPTGEDPSVLRLRVEAALTLVPLISRVVVNRSDRRAVVADAVDRWLALPAEARRKYSRATGSEDEGLERFCWDFVDAVEQEALPPGDGGQPAGLESESMAVDAAERILITLWHQYLRARPE